MDTIRIHGLNWWSVLTTDGSYSRSATVKQLRDGTLVCSKHAHNCNHKRAISERSNQVTEEQYQVTMKELMRIETEMHELEMKYKRLDETLQDMFNRLEMERPSDSEA